MDPRVPITVKSNGDTFALGKRFKSLAEAEVEVAKIIQHRETLAGRLLTGRELRDGPAIHDTRTEREKIADAQWQPKMAKTKPVDGNPFREVDDDDDVSPREAMRRKAELEWDEKKAQAVDRTSPQRLLAVAEAEQTLGDLRYEPNVSAAEIEHAERLVVQARVGDLAVYRQMAKAVTDLRIEKYGDAAAQTQARIEQAQAELAAMQQRMNQLRPTEQPTEPEQPTDKREYLHLGHTIIEFANGRRIGAHDPATCDPSIVEQAE